MAIELKEAIEILPFVAETRVWCVAPALDEPFFGVPLTVKVFFAGLIYCKSVRHKARDADTSDNDAEGEKGRVDDIGSTVDNWNEVILNRGSWPITVTHFPSQPWAQPYVLVSACRRQTAATILLSDGLFAITIRILKSTIEQTRFEVFRRSSRLLYIWEKERNGGVTQ